MRRFSKASFFETGLQLAQEEESKPPFYKVVNRVLQFDSLSESATCCRKNCRFQSTFHILLN